MENLELIQDLLWLIWIKQYTRLTLYSFWLRSQNQENLDTNELVLETVFETLSSCFCWRHPK